MSAVGRPSHVDEPDSDRDAPVVPPEEVERVMRRFFEKHGATLAQRVAPPAPISEVRRAPPAQAEPACPPALIKPTVRLPVFDADPRPQGIRERPAHNDVAPPRAPVFPRPPVVPAPAALTRTELPVPRSAEEWAQARWLPFLPAPPLQPQPGHGLAGTVKLPVMGLGTGKTLPLGDDSMARVLAALPFVPPTPQLTREQYASLRAELAVSPERAAAILSTYRVESEAACRVLDAAWEAHFAPRPEVRAAFEKDLARFTAWLRGEGT